MTRPLGLTDNEIQLELLTLSFFKIHICQIVPVVVLYLEENLMETMIKNIMVCSPRQQQRNDQFTKVIPFPRLVNESHAVHEITERDTWQWK